MRVSSKDCFRVCSWAPFQSKVFFCDIASGMRDMRSWATRVRVFSCEIMHICNMSHSSKNDLSDPRKGRRAHFRFSKNPQMGSLDQLFFYQRAASGRKHHLK